jgi:ATP-dependent RNA helicase SUPV3L1/SUV3
LLTYIEGGGVYCGPLRLLALEIFENLNRSGVHCNLLTGQEKHEVPSASHTACTVEMINTKVEYDVAVIDEIQMIGNDQRGNGWTRALLGLRANEIHVCGGLEAFNIVKSLVDSIGDDFEFKKYDRLSTLNIADVSLRGDYSKIQPGDCVVAFNRQDIFAIKHDIERLTSHKCAVIYGQLPPETRSMQARLFNDDNTGFDVLVASDAIGTTH